MATEIKVESFNFEASNEYQFPCSFQIKEEKYEIPDEIKEEQIEHFVPVGQNLQPWLESRAEDPLCTLKRPVKVELNTYQFKCISSEDSQPVLETPSNKSNKGGRKLIHCTFGSCTKSFTQSGHLADHMRVHTGEKPYICTHENCGKSFKTSSALKVHSQGHTGEKSYICGDCGKAFKYSSSLINHQKLHSVARPYECDFPDCDRSFKRRVDLNSHKKNVHIQGGYVCEYKNCGKVYDKIKSFSFHMRSHREDKPLKCPHEGCPRTFWFKHYFTEHQRVHMGEKPFVCDHPNCGKKYTSKVQLKLHRTEHENRVFVCTFSDANKTIDNGEASEVCAKVFKSKKLLSDHMRRHIGVRRYKCEVADCKKEFLTNKELTNHLRMHARKKI